VKTGSLRQNALPLRLGNDDRSADPVGSTTANTKGFKRDRERADDQCHDGAGLKERLKRCGRLGVVVMNIAVVVIVAISLVVVVVGQDGRVNPVAHV